MRLSFIQRISFVKYFLYLLIFSFYLSGCRKSVDQNLATYGKTRLPIKTVNTGLISKWYDWYNQSINNAPALEFSLAQRSIIKGNEVIRIPVKGSRGMVYFFQSNELNAVFVRDNRRVNSNEKIKSNIEFINLNTIEYKVATFKDGKVDSLFTALLNQPGAISNTSSSETILKQSSGTFWFDLGCIFSLGIPRWGPTGERECWGLNIWGWLGEAFTEDESGERDLDGGAWTSFQSGYFAGIGLEPGNNEPSDPGSFANFLSTISIDPTTIAPENWNSIDDDFYAEDGDGEDVANSTDTGPLGYFPSYFSFSGGRVINITFGTTSDAVSANQEVSQKLIDAVKDALDVASQSVNITSIHIKATTNGSHATSSNHYKKLAVDISRINGIPLITMGANSIVTTFQNALDQVTGRRENFGPAFKHKLGSVVTNISGHADHIHFSVNGY